jgi:DNA-binding IclR family transcriptional regulator
MKAQPSFSAVSEQTSVSRRSQEDRYYVRAVGRALSILKLLTEQEDLTLAAIGRQVNLPQSTTFRLLVTLVGAGFVEQPKNGSGYRLGVECLALGDAFLKTSDLRRVAEDHLAHLRDHCGETVHLAVFEGWEVVYLLKLPGLHPIGLMSSRAGGRAPAHCTGLGKAMLAFVEPDTGLLPSLKKTKLKRFTRHTLVDWRRLETELRETRKRGYSMDNEEHEEGVACVAAPIFDHEGLAAAISASGPVDRIRDQMKEADLAEAVVRTAGEITSSLGGTVGRSGNVG